MADWGALVEDQEQRLAQKVETLVVTPKPVTPTPVLSYGDGDHTKLNLSARGAASEINHPSNDGGADGEEDEEPEVKKEEESLLQKLIHAKLVQSETDIEVLRKDPNSPLHSVKSFEALNLKPELLKGIYKMGFSAPSKIQETALPTLLADPPVNMIAQSQSGTGKTAAFVLTMLTRVDTNAYYPQCLCLAPTYELALQIGEVIKQMAQFMTNLQIRYAVRGERVSRGEIVSDHIIIGTPGTVMDWALKYRVLALEKLKVFVLDEADVMISMQGHQDQSTRIQKKLSRDCQMLLFSATYDDAVMQFAQRIIPNDPVVIKLRRDEESLDNIKQFYIECDNKEDKLEALNNIYSAIAIGQSMIFCHTKKTAHWLAEKMTQADHTVGLLTGDLTIEQRAAIIKRFRDGKEKVLITTNVSARGIDVESVTVVINFDLPLTLDYKADCETYLHRIGRTGRFGKSGLAVNMVDGPRNMAILKTIEQHFGRKIKKLDADDLDELEKINS